MRTVYEADDGETFDTEDEALEHELSSAWPRDAKVHLHGNKEANWDKGTDIGLSDDAISEKFAYALYEVSFDLRVNEDGTYRIASVTCGDESLYPPR